MVLRGQLRGRVGSRRDYFSTKPAQGKLERAFHFLNGVHEFPEEPMKNIGRNDPCPCGSGKKYKTYCLASAKASDFQYRHSRQTYAGLIPKLMEFAFENIHREVLDAAWVDFNDDDAVEDYNPNSPMNQLFMPWFLFNWIVELKPTGATQYSETTIAELFLLSERKRINSDEDALLRSAIRCPYTLCEIVEVKPAIGMTLFDLLRLIKFEVVERSGSEIVKRGDIPVQQNLPNEAQKSTLNLTARQINLRR